MAAKFVAACTAFVGLMLIGGNADAAFIPSVTIDDFSSGSVSLYGTNPSGFVAEAESGLDVHTLGGNRTTGLKGIRTAVELNTWFAGYLLFSNDALGQGSLQLLYTVVGEKDLTIDQANAVALDIEMADQPADIWVSVNDGEAVHRNIPTGKQQFQIPFADFPDTDFTKVTKLEVVMRPSNLFGGDYVIDGVSVGKEVVVPLPASLAGGLALLGGLGLLSRRRRG